jgi:hypothetical protein
VNDSSTYWLTIMNLTLGAATLLGIGFVAFGVWREWAARRSKRVSLARLDREVSTLVAGFDPRAFHLPGLGTTMADGGEEIRKDEEQR